MRSYSQKMAEKIIAELNYTEKNLFKIDEEFINFSARKNTLEGDFYKVKNLIQNNNMTNVQYNGKNIMSCLQEIEDQINDSYNNEIKEDSDLNENYEKNITMIEACKGLSDVILDFKIYLMKYCLKNKNKKEFE